LYFGSGEEETEVYFEYNSFEFVGICCFEFVQVCGKDIREDIFGTVDIFVVQLEGILILCFLMLRISEALGRPAL
jgi:hypothetical protein